MSNPFIFGGLANIGNSFLKSYQAETDRLERKSSEAEERQWRNEQRDRQRQDWQRKDQERQILEDSFKPIEVEKSYSAGEEGPVVEMGIDGQKFTDVNEARAAEQKANSATARTRRAADRMMSVNPELGLGLRKAAVESVKADNSLDEETQKQVRNTFNNQLIEMVPATGNWAESAVSSMDSLAGRKVARYEVSDDKKFVSIYGPGDKGQEVKVGTFANDAAGRLDFLDMAMKRPPEDMIKLLDARRLLLENERKKREEQAAKDESWRERQLFAASLRDGGGGSSGGGQGRSGGGRSSAPASTPGSAADVSQEVLDQIDLSIKETSDAYKLPPDARAAVKNTGYNLAAKNPGITPTLAVESAFMIATKPESVKPYFDKSSGSVVLGFQHPRNGKRMVVDQVDESMLSDKDKAQIAPGVKELVSEYETRAPGLASLIKQSAYDNGGKPSPELKNALVQAHMQAIEQQRRAQNQPPLSAIQLNSEATKRADAQLPLVASHIRAISRYLPQEKSAPKGRSDGAVKGRISDGLGLRQTEYQPPTDSPAGRAAAARETAKAAAASRDAQAAEQRRKSTEAATARAQQVIQSKDVAAAAELQDSELFSYLPSDVKIRVRNIVMGR